MNEETTLTPIDNLLSKLFTDNVSTGNQLRTVSLTSAQLDSAKTVISSLLSSLQIKEAIDSSPFPSVVTAIQSVIQNVMPQSLSLVLSADLKSVDFISFIVQVSADNQLSFTVPHTKQTFILNNVLLDVVAYNDSISADYDQWRATLVADTTLFGLVAEISINLPDFVTTLQMTPQTDVPPASVAQAIEDLNCPSNASLSSLLDKINLAYFEAYIDLGQSMFAMQLSITDRLPPWNGFALNSVSITTTYAAGTVSFSMSALATIGTALVQVTFTDDGSGGLVLDSSAQFASPLDVNDFASNLAQTLGVNLLPSPFPFDLQITSLDIQIGEASGSVSFVSASCDAVLVIEESGTPIQLSVDMQKSSGDLSVTLRLGGLTLTDHSSVSTSVFSATPGDDSTLPLTSIVALLGLDWLADAAAQVDINVQGLFLAANKKPAHLFGLKLGLEATLPPSILDLITGGKVGLTDVTLLAANAPWSRDDLGAISVGGFTFPPQAPRGPSFAATLTVGGNQVFAPLLPSGQQPSASPSSGLAAPAPVTSPSAARWFDVQKQVGPLYLARAGFAANGGSPADVLCDASFTLGPITLSLDGFSIAVPFASGAKLFDITVALHGLSLAYNKPPLTISGGFLQTSDDVYTGAAMLQNETLSLAAFGKYAKADGITSLALFAVLNNPPLGGPVFCFVTGLAAGFGYNSKLNMPATASDVATFPLLKAAAPGGASPTDLMVITNCATPTLGEDWLAVGLLFRSFELIQSTALLTAAFGHDLQFAILGQSEISIPPESPDRLAYAQVDIEATYSPAAGELRVLGVLAPNSFVLDPDCHLSGGFAYILKGSGDFMVTFGGYAQGFNYALLDYPPVSPLQLQWQVDDHTSIKGDAYFALTPAVMMAGGSLQATWDSGIFSAWFTLQMDLFMTWRPFSYQGDFSMSLGVSFDLDVQVLWWTVSVHFTYHVGASLYVAGPPFHGTAEIDLDVVSFTISFGGSPGAPPALCWDEFRAILPPNAAGQDDQSNSALLSAKVTDGLVADLSQTKAAGGLDWVVNGTHFCLEIRSSLPVTQPSAGKVSVTLAPSSPAIGILPMGIGSANGTLDVSLTDSTGTVHPTDTHPTSPIVVETIQAALAPAHWGTTKADMNDPTPLGTFGYRLYGGRPDPDRTATILVKTLLSQPDSVTAISDRAASAQPF